MPQLGADHTLHPILWAEARFTFPGQGAGRSSGHSGWCCPQWQRPVPCPGRSRAGPVRPEGAQPGASSWCCQHKGLLLLGRTWPHFDAL